MRCGRSGRVTERKPRAALRRISGRPEFGVGQEGDAARDDAVGVGLPPCLVEPVVPRLRDRQAQLGVTGRPRRPARRTR